MSRLATAGVAVALVGLLGLPPGGLAAGSTDEGPSDPASPVPRATSLSGARPDIVVLLLDDMAEIDRRVWERLPTIRRLFLEHGTRFPRASVNDPLCCPGRAAILTGQRTIHHGVFHNAASLLDPTVTLATELQAAGYHTLFAGKYLSRPGLLDEPLPPGWDHALIMGGGYWDVPAWRDGTRHRVGRTTRDYTTDLLTRTAGRWLDDAPADRPLFLFLSPFAVHAGADRAGRSMGYLQPVPAPRHVADARCAGIPPWAPPGHRERDVRDKPAHIRARPPGPYPRGWPLERTCETLLSVDELVAEVTRRLARAGRDDVLFLLTSDNGMAWGAHRWSAKRIAYSTPVPLFLHWPRGLGMHAVTLKDSVSNIDLAPTLCDLAGCTMGPYPDGDPVDGLSLVPLLDGRAPALSRELLFEEHFTRYLGPRWVGVRTAFGSPAGRWVYTRYETGEEELYDLARDRYRLRNLARDPAYEDIRRSLAEVVLRTYGPDWPATFRP